MSDPTAADLWRQADELERAGRVEPLVVGSAGQPVLNRSLRKAQALRAEARRLEGLPVRRGDTPTCVRMAAAADLEGLADTLESVGAECPSAGRLARQIRRHLDLAARVVRTPPRPCGNPSCSALLPPVYITQVGRSRLYCSDACRSAVHPSPPTAQRGPRPCEFCGWTFDGSHAGHRFCSTDCSNALGRKIRRTKSFTLIDVLDCGQCGHVFVSTFGQQKYCSDRCNQIAKRRRRGISPHWPKAPSTRLNWSQCRECSTWYIKRSGTTVCGQSCADTRRDRQLAAGRRRARETFVSVAVTNPMVTHRCVECGSTFTTNKHSALRKYCSTRCGRRAVKRTRRHLERAAERAGEHFTVREIADRDGWVCHICQRRIPDKGSWTNEDDDPTIDHLVPLSRGGEHTRVNVAIAHRLCNSCRGATGIAQLRLIA